MMTTTQSLKWRYATKLFDSEKKISDDDLTDLLAALQWSPSSYGLQPWHFLVITDPDLRAQLKPHAWDQPQITDCSHLVVLCARTGMDEAYIDRHTKNLASTRGVEVSDLDGYKDMMTTGVMGKSAEDRQAWMQKQIYLALGFLMSACMNKQIDCCPMEGFVKEEFDAILGLPEQGWTSVVLCAMGYRSSEDKYAEAAKTRWEHSEVIEMR